MKDGRGPINDVTPRLRGFAKEQRSTMPRAEELFWREVRAGRFHGYKFKRQVPIAPYIVDFLCSAAKVVVELDGAPHDTEERRQKDAARDAWLREQGFCVLRFPNDAVLGNCGLVLDEVRRAILARLDPSPAPLCGAPSPAEGERGIPPAPGPA